MNENLKPVKELTPFTKMIMSIGTLPSSFYASMSYYESMVWLYEYLKNQIIPTVNNNGEAVEELQVLYLQLKEYVETYFDNLDIQEEINNKLDEMAEDGTLADIIADYIQLKGQLVYNSVAEMKNAENLYNGSFAKTYGFYSYNDGGGALYKIRTITNDDIVDEMTIIALYDNTLIAELIIEDYINANALGLSTELLDNTFILSKCNTIASSTYKPIIIQGGTYTFTGEITLSTNVYLKGNGGNEYNNTKGTTLKYTGNNTFLTLQGTNLIENLNIEGTNLSTGINIFGGSRLINVFVSNCLYGFVTGVSENSPASNSYYEGCGAYLCETGFKIDSDFSGIGSATRWANNSVFMKCKTDVCKYGVYVNCYDIFFYDLCIQSCTENGIGIELAEFARGCSFTNTYIENTATGVKNILLDSGAQRNSFYNFRYNDWLYNITDNSGYNNNIFEGYWQSNSTFKAIQGNVAFNNAGVYVNDNHTIVYGYMKDPDSNDKVIEGTLLSNSNVVTKYADNILHDMRNYHGYCRGARSYNNMAIVRYTPSSETNDIIINAGGYHTFTISQSRYATTNKSCVMAQTHLPFSTHGLIAYTTINSSTYAIDITIYNSTSNAITLPAPASNVTVDILLWEDIT